MNEQGNEYLRRNTSRGPDVNVWKRWKSFNGEYKTSPCSLTRMNETLVTDLSQFIDANLHELELRTKYSRRHLKEIYEEVIMHLNVASADLKILEQLGER